jgi:hypothetical protein
LAERDLQGVPLRACQFCGVMKVARNSCLSLNAIRRFGGGGRPPDVIVNIEPFPRRLVILLHLTQATRRQQIVV